jgi:DMSO/TMAO reductase YedYZ molybdopterin-dependent catalytic subunit
MSERDRDDVPPPAGEAGAGAADARSTGAHPAGEPATPTDDANPAARPAREVQPAASEPGKQASESQPAAEAVPEARPAVGGPTAYPATPAAAKPAAPAPPPRRRGWLDALAERLEVAVEVPRRDLEVGSRRDFLLFAAGLLATAVGAWWLLPDATRGRLVGMSRRERLDSLAARVGLSRERRERTLDRALTFDDDVSEALYSKDRRVRTYDRSDVTHLRNNYHGQTPGPEFLPSWSLNLSGLASGRSERLSLDALLRRFTPHEQITRLVCVEGWSAVAWWGGIRFADLLAAFPPAAGARWAAMRSTVSLDRAGRREPYYVSIDLGTARHPQTLLATHQDGRPLTLAHGAPLRLVAPMKLGLKNIKGLTDIAYTAGEPPDYWNERGYSKYDGL